LSAKVKLPTVASTSARLAPLAEAFLCFEKRLQRLELLERLERAAVSSNEGLVSRDRKAIREKIETEPKIRKWFQDLATIST